jgi:hypothetical protein
VKAGLVVPMPTQGIYFTEKCIVMMMSKMKEVTGDSRGYFLSYVASLFFLLTLQTELSSLSNAGREKK